MKDQNDKMLARKQGSVGHMIFNNPQKHNAVSLDMWDAADAILDDFEKDAGVRVVVLSGAGGKSFVSGSDISKFEKVRSSEEAVRHYNDRIELAYDRIHTFPKPTIAMIDGYCIGGGLNLAVICDLRFCSASSTFAMPAARLALGYPYPAIKRLTDAIGPAAAKHLMFTAQPIDAQEAWRLGLVQKILAEEELEAFVADYAGKIAANAPLAVRAARRVMRQAGDLSAADAIALEAGVAAELMTSEDAVEGPRAFLEKRPPVFKGR